MIKLQKIYKSFGSTKVINDLSFSVESGEVVGLLGPNGAGKTTTMRLITGFLSADRGIIEVQGINVLENSEEAQNEIGYMPENNPLYKNMLVKEMLNFVAQMHKMTPEAINKSLDFLVPAIGLTNMYNRPIHELSKGYRQRVGLACALIHNPRVLILDEPTEGLDPNQRVEIRHLIKQIAKDRTVLISTHVMQEAEAMCGRLLIINRGRLVADGTSKQILAGKSTSSEYSLEIEGKNVQEQLSKINDIKIAETDQKANRAMLTATVLNNYQLPPKISELAKTNNWIIWKIVENKGNLEDVFRELTT